MSSPNQGKLTPPSFAALVQSFFTDHLTQQRALSARTVAAYRDAFLLFLGFAQARLHKAPTAMRPRRRASQPRGSSQRASTNGHAKYTNASRS